MQIFNMYITFHTFNLRMVVFVLFSCFIEMRDVERMLFTASFCCSDNIPLHCSLLFRHNTLTLLLIQHHIFLKHTLFSNLFF